MMTPDQISAYATDLIVFMVSGLGVGLGVGLLALITRMRG